MRLAERALRLLLDPLVQAAKMVAVHALDLSHLLPVLEPAQADGAVLVPQVADDFPLNAILIGLGVLLPEEELVGDS